MHSKLKIFMTGLLPDDLSIKGGVVAANLNLFKGFEKLPVEVVHVSFNRDISEEVVRQLAPNVRIHFLPFKVRFDLLDYVFNRRRLAEILGEFKPHVIHIQEITPHLLRFVHLPKGNIVVTQHGVMREELRTAAGLKEKAKMLFKVLVERFVFPMYRNIIFISNYNRQLFPGKNACSAQIYNPVGYEFFEGALNEAPGLYKSLVYVGVINHRKNLKLLIQALVALKQENIELHLHVVGGFRDSAYENEINSLVAASGVASQVRFHGWQSPAGILEINKQAGVFVLPSLQETLPVSIAEAMAQGKVVVASNVGAIGEMFTDGKSGLLFEKGNLQDLCAKLKWIYENESAAKEMGANAHRVATESYHPDIVAQKTVEFYREVLLRTNTPS